jgi:hypothetical protein
VAAWQVFSGYSGEPAGFGSGGRRAVQIFLEDGSGTSALRVVTIQHLQPNAEQSGIFAQPCKAQG